VVHLIRPTITVVPPRLRVLVWRAWLAVLALGAGACSLLVDTDAAQCHTDHDCVSFGAVGDTRRSICVARVVGDAGADLHPDAGAHDAGETGADGDADASADADALVGDAPAAQDGGDAGLAADGALCHTGDGCRPCPAGAAGGFANACSDVTCVSFDNHARLRNLLPDGGLKPLP